MIEKTFATADKAAPGAIAAGVVGSMAAGWIPADYPLAVIISVLGLLSPVFRLIVEKTKLEIERDRLELELRKGGQDRACQPPMFDVTRSR